MKRTLCLLYGILYLCGWVAAQDQHPYILNGSATQTSCNCYVLTEDIKNQGGTVWNKNKIDLRESFNYVFDVNLGCKDLDGADGIGFILQTRGTNLGSSGGGLGFKGISPSLGVLIDTYQNLGDHDPTWDHLAIQANGDLDHATANNLAGPVMLLDGVENIEDCQWHLFRIKWDASAHVMEVSVDGQLRLTLKKDILNDIFNGDPMVFWGFAGSTGGLSNKQQFCAALRPAFDFTGGQVLCEGTPAKFRDNSNSFGVITRWWWDMGDGSRSVVAQPPPHQYPAAGNYLVKLVIEDNSGCISDTLKSPVTIGSYPVADFSANTLCLGTPLNVKDQSTVKVGTLQQWQWNWGDGTTSTVQNPVAPYTTAGSHPVKLKVTTKEGCSSEVTKQIDVRPMPKVKANGRNVCIGEVSQFTGTNLTPQVPVKDWAWEMGDASIVRGKDISYRYTAGGKYTVRLHAISNDGCVAVPSDLPVEVVALQLDAGRDTIIARDQPLQLNAVAQGSNLRFVWSPVTGLDDPYSASPKAFLQKDQTYHVTVTSPEGCMGEGVVRVKVYEGPEFYVPTAFTPNHDGHNDQFRVIAAGVPQIDFFRIWNRWGQEMYRTSTLPAVWDGTLNGKPAEADTYVWMVQGVDYKGRRFSRKGTVTLIR